MYAIRRRLTFPLFFFSLASQHCDDDDIVNRRRVTYNDVLYVKQIKYNSFSDKACRYTKQDPLEKKNVLIWQNILPYTRLYEISFFYAYKEGNFFFWLIIW